MDWEAGSESRKLMEKFLAGLSPWQRRKLLAKADRRFERKLRQAQFRAYAPPQGYCCPRCHAWHPTPEARLACRRSHLLVGGAIWS